MSRNLLPSAISYLESATNVRIAYLIRLELSESTELSKSYIYLTNYHSDISWGGQVYEAGKVLKVGNLRQTQGLTNYKLNIDIAGEYQEELDRALVENLDKSYVGKEIEILQAHLDNAGDIIPMDATTNGPMQYFIGDITNIDIQENVINGNSTVSWQCAGKFQDFELINGRITDDAAHRGLISQPNGDSVPSTGAKRVEHQSDTGFQHANQTLSVVTKYTTLETRYKLKKSWGGLKTSLREYQEEVEKSLELGVDLAASYLPKIYGVRKVSGIPVFIDTLKNDPSKLVIVYAFACGEIDSFLNFYLDGQSIICSSELDKENRLCLGNQANGDTLSAFISDGAYIDWLNYTSAWTGTTVRGDRFDEIGFFPIPPLPPTTNGRTRTEGTSHEDYFTITDDSGNRWIQVFHGTSDQAACDRLVQYAANDNFLLQEAWATKTGRPASEYWDANCRLLDTAYVMMEVVISEESTTIPELEAVISGSLVDTFDSNLNKSTKQYTLNPVWQLLDYILDPMVGGGLDPTLVNYQSFYDVAAQLDEITTTYEDSFLTYWRYLGWKDEPGTNTITIGSDEHDLQKTKLQTNVVFRTEEKVTKNIESLLNQFDGTINILGGKYHLSIENNATPIADLTIKDIKGAIKTTDLSNKNKWNSIQASIQDPGQGWNSTQISFFNSEYLQKDNGVPKKGNVFFNYITNYYTAREWAQKQLAKSRFSREITFTTYYKYMYLYPNCTVTFTYDRFGYDQKVFRVKSTTLVSDGLVELVLEDYAEAEYENSIDNSGETTTIVPEVLPPQGIEYVALPSARFPSINPDLYQDVNGLLLWEVPDDPSVLNYQVLNWKGNGIVQFGVPTDQTITDDNGDTFVFLKIDELEPNEDYSFKVKTVSYTGRSSKYAIVQITTTPSLPDPISFSPVTNFISPNADDLGYFTGTDLEMSWDQHPNGNVSKYELQIRNFNGTQTFRTETINNLLPLEYTYTLAKNIADYATLNGGNSGATRQLTARIRATNGLSSGDPDFVSSPWVDLI